MVQRLAVCGELFYRSNVRSPRWMRYVTQMPEVHWIHHQRDVHRFADLPV